MLQRTLNSTISGQLLSLQPVSIHRQSLIISVDPRMELLSIVQWLSNHADKFPVMTRLCFPYREAVEKVFAPHQGHDAVKIFDQLSSREYSPEAPPFYFGAPPEAMLYLLPDFTLHPDIFCNQFLVNRAGGQASLERFVDALKGFYMSTGFPSFYQAHLPDYQQMVGKAADTIGSKDYIGRLETFYGQRQRSYSFLLVSLYATLGYGPHLESCDGTRHIYSILGPKTVDGDLPSFGDQARVDLMLTHELSHPFINPLTEKHLDQVNRLTRSDLIEEVKASSGYGEWYDVVNEYLIRAVTTHLAYQESTSKGDQELQIHISKGFSQLDALLRKLNEYAQNREAYPDFDSFYLQLIAVLAAVR